MQNSARVLLCLTAILCLPLCAAVSSAAEELSLQVNPRSPTQLSLHNLRSDYAHDNMLAAHTGVHRLSAQVTDIWGGASESIALEADGTVWTWGWDDYGILGNGFGVSMFDTDTQYNRLVPAKVLGTPNPTRMTAATKAIGNIIRVIARVRSTWKLPIEVFPPRPRMNAAPQARPVHV